MARLHHHLSRLSALLALVLSAAVMPTSAAHAEQESSILGQIPPHGGSITPQRVASLPPQLTYHRGPVMHAHRIHAIYWAPPGVSFPPGYTQQIDTFLAAVSRASGRSDNVYSTAAQYGDASGAGTYRASYAAAILDPQPYPRQVCADPSTRLCVTDGQVRAEIDRVIGAKRLVRGLGDFYVVFTPSDVGNCADTGSATCAYRDYCGFHSFYGSGRARTIYALLPYSDVSACRPTIAGPHAGHADPTIDALSHEHIEAITDPLGDGWTDSAGNEIADKCETSYGRALGSTPFGPFNQSISSGVYRLQAEWSNSARACVLRR